MYVLDFEVTPFTTVIKEHTKILPMLEVPPPLSPLGDNGVHSASALNMNHDLLDQPPKGRGFNGLMVLPQERLLGHVSVLLGCTLVKPE